MQTALASMMPSLQSVGSLLDDYYRSPEIEADFSIENSSSEFPGFFRLRNGLICYGRPAGPRPAKTTRGPLPESAIHVRKTNAVSLPFDPSDVIGNLLMERYVGDGENHRRGAGTIIRRLYYLLRPALPTDARKYLQRFYLRGWKRFPFPQWPVDCTVDRLHQVILEAAMQAQGVQRVPFVWFWPDGRTACATITHDIETAAGRDFCSELMDINDAVGIKSSFQVVPEDRYEVTPRFLSSLRERGFEINIHDLNHDGNLFVEHNQFLDRAKKINRYGKEFGVRGFRSAVLYRKIDWMDALDFAYDMSIPNVAHLDPQRGGCCTIMPYFVGDRLEIPVTTTQDYSLFHILSDYSTRLWEQQLKIITEAHGLASFIVHPDYVIEKRARSTYKQLLNHLTFLREQQDVWVALPGEINDWWRSRAKMRVCKAGDIWRVEGPGSERACVGFASLENNQLHYCIQ